MWKQNLSEEAEVLKCNCAAGQLQVARKTNHVGEWGGKKFNTQQTKKSRNTEADWEEDLACTKSRVLRVTSLTHNYFQRHTVVNDLTALKSTCLRMWLLSLSSCTSATQHTGDGKAHKIPDLCEAHPSAFSQNKILNVANLFPVVSHPLQYLPHWHCRAVMEIPVLFHCYLKKRSSSLFSFFMCCNIHQDHRHASGHWLSLPLDFRGFIFGKWNVA